MCGDGASIVVAGNGDSIYQRYMETIGRPELGADPGLQTNAGRWARREELDAAIGAMGRAAQPRPRRLRRLDAAGVPAGPIYTAADIVRRRPVRGTEHDPEIRCLHRRGELTGIGFPGIVPVIGGQSLPIRNLGPDLGENTEEVLGGLLGMDATTRSMPHRPRGGPQA